MDKSQLVAILNEIGLLLELRGENPFKSRAYYNAARTLENSNLDLEAAILEGRLHEWPGFGETLIKKILEWRETGTIKAYEELKQMTPPGLLTLLGIPGLGVKKIHLLHERLGITGPEDLAMACRQNKLLALPGMGVKTQEKILAGLQFLQKQQGLFLGAEVWRAIAPLVENLRRQPGVERVEVAGSLRRFSELVKDADLVAAAANPVHLIQSFISWPRVKQVIASGTTKASVILADGLNVDLRVVESRQFPHLWQHFTGSKEHNTALRHLAKAMGYRMNEYGLFKGNEVIYCRDEAEIYQFLGLDAIPPELREDMGEIVAATSHLLPELVTAGEIRGVFHVHTLASDGTASLRELVEACLERGYSYLGVSDHSRSAVYARGLALERLELQMEEIDQLNREYAGFKIFKGIEADILADGRLDYPDEVLARLDFVIGSIHSHFQMSREAMTDRILKALDNPYLTMLGHPSGRILLQRPPYEADLEAVIGRAVQNGVILEFNASPWRLDLDWRWCKKAKEQGAIIAINPDAHSLDELDLIYLNLAVARKGWLEAGDIFNTRTREEVASYFNKRGHSQRC